MVIFGSMDMVDQLAKGGIIGSYCAGVQWTDWLFINRFSLRQST